MLAQKSKGFANKIINPENKINKKNPDKIQDMKTFLCHY